ncbi:flagellar biosynthetic protein FlhF [Desulfosporosinus acidiphilus SJ4]|uniref:Flagellar biosynthesis protein FlhF n=1 Tax=Desulfosporosinus acidiphilus (strain DSM 22704 / JCM 16185 / SJ4) TaxID=646529 RepID=U3GJN0_DESAJ|nr:flagellar biosynthesis protein FlhF [Desulfosporosinus acidiphilus]AFM42692.1 flagellar biosynthetic protein FlhF [Desulfosporosinus acidiphilus SJ4]
MRVKRFVGDNVTDTMGKVKRELGSDAVILQTREFREGGFLGFFGTMKVEITAAIEEKPVSDWSRYDNNIEEERPVRIAPRPEVQIRQETLQRDTQVPSETIQPDLKSMYLLLEKVNQQIEELGSERKEWPPTLQKWVDRLLDRGVEETIIKRIISHLQQRLPENQWNNDSEVYSQIETEIMEICGTTEPIQTDTDKPLVIALIGPTGVGKTTTIGKLAAGFSIVDKRKVALITADTYRVAAVEQIKTFGEIIGVPVDVVMTPTELQMAKNRHKDKDLIFIDTAGRSPHHDLHMSELRAFLKKANPDYTMLVMSATTQLADQLKIYQRFKDVSTHFIFTKLDETDSAGTLLNFLDQAELPTAYLTNGQNVPDDIVAANQNRIARFVFGEEKHCE